MDPLKADVDRATRRAALYWVEDGLQETLLGAFLLLIGLFLALQDVLPKTHPLQFVFAAGFPLLLVSLGVAVRSLLMRLKDRYVHPRTGYVSFRQAGRVSSVLAAVLAGVIGFGVVLLMNVPAAVAWLPAIQGIAFAAVFLYLGRKVPLARFPIEGLLAVVGGLVLALARLAENVASGLLFMWIGAVMAAAGALAFRCYLRNAPRGEHA